MKQNISKSFFPSCYLDFAISHVAFIHRKKTRTIQLCIHMHSTKKTSSHLFHGFSVVLILLLVLLLLVGERNILGILKICINSFIFFYNKKVPQISNWDDWRNEGDMHSFLTIWMGRSSLMAFFVPRYCTFSCMPDYSPALFVNVPNLSRIRVKRMGML